MIEFLAYVVGVSLIVSFLRTLAAKWGILDYLQLNAPNEFFHKLFTCEFCQSFHLGMIVSIIFAICTGEVILLLVPFLSCNIRW